MNQINLRGADLGQAVLRGTYCYFSDFSEADLSWADIQYANLSNATFYKTQLSEASLASTNLSNANFNQAVFKNTSLREAIVNDTIFAALDLGGALHLDMVFHDPESTLSIGTDTLVTTIHNAGGQFTEEQEAFFAKGGVAREMLNTVRHSGSSIGGR
jgi:uncharacterized protein YjbI with pentapeptide repeats